MTAWGAVPDQHHPGLPQAGSPGTRPSQVRSDHTEQWGLCSHLLPRLQVSGSRAQSPIPTAPQMEEMRLDHAKMFLPSERGTISADAERMFQPGALA